MSRYEWERGEILLPSAQVAPLRRALVAKQNELHALALAAAKEFWSKHQTRSTKKYNEALERWLQTSPTVRRLRDQLGSRFYSFCGLLEDLAEKPRQLQKKDLAGHEHLAPATTRTADFSGASCHISFQERKLFWSVSEGNHSRDRADEDPVAQTLFKHLRTMTWTRGTGGHFIGNDENNIDAGQDSIGGGGNYMTSRFGPLGTKALEEDYMRRGFSAKDAKKYAAQQDAAVEKPQLSYGNSFGNYGRSSGYGRGPGW